MKRLFILLGFLWIIPLLSIAQDNMTTVWQYSPVTIDGLSDEWIDNLRYLDSETQFYYGVTNDDKNLYMCFFTANQMRQMKIFRTGMKIELKIKGKSKRTAYIIYPKKDTNSFLMRNKPAGENETQKERTQSQNKGAQGRNMSKRFLENNPTFVSDGFVAFNGVFPVTNQGGISLAINWDETKRMAYEIVIPLKELFGESYSLENISKTDIKLKIIIDAMEMPDSSGQRSAGGAPGGRMQQGGGQAQGTGGQTMEDRAFLFQEQRFTYNFRLANK